MKYKTTKYIVIVAMVFMSSNLWSLGLACKGSPWEVCWITPAEGNVHGVPAIFLRTKNGQTYNNIRLTWNAVGATGPVELVTSPPPHCISATTNEASGCIIFPDTSGINTGVSLGFDSAQDQYLYFDITVSRVTPSGEVNLIKTTIGPVAPSIQ